MNATYFKLALLLILLISACESTELIEVTRSIETSPILNTCTLEKAASSRHAVWMGNYKNGPHALFFFDESPGTITFQEDGGAHITGNIYLPDRPQDKWRLSVWIDAPMNWDEWSALGRSYKGDPGRVGERYRSWTYYRFNPEKTSTLTGEGVNEGLVLDLTQVPEDLTYGLQLGAGANDVNNNYGLSVWYSYVWNNEVFRGDFNFDLACAIAPNDFLYAENAVYTVPNKFKNESSIGNMPAISNRSDIFYSIASQSPAGAVRIDPSTGVLRVANEKLFDYRIHPIVSVTAVAAIPGETVRAEITIRLDPLDDFQLTTLDYFKEIALGFEFGDATEVTRRWNRPVKIYPYGNPSDELLSELDRIITEINGLITNGIQLSIVENPLEANVEMFFGAPAVYIRRNPSQSDLVDASFGLYTVFYNSANQLFAANIFIDTDRTNETLQKHAIREELTQVLGLGKDSPRFRDSIFSLYFTTQTNEYAPIDRELIRLLYHPQMTAGLNAAAVEEVVRGILAPK